MTVADLRQHCKISCNHDPTKCTQQHSSNSLSALNDGELSDRIGDCHLGKVQWAKVVTSKKVKKIKKTTYEQHSGFQGQENQV